MTNATLSVTFLSLFFLTVPQKHRLCRLNTGFLLYIHNLSTVIDQILTNLFEFVVDKKIVVFI